MLGITSISLRHRIQPQDILIDDRMKDVPPLRRCLVPMVRDDLHDDPFWLPPESDPESVFQLRIVARGQALPQLRVQFVQTAVEELQTIHLDVRNALRTLQTKEEFLVTAGCRERGRLRDRLGRWSDLSAVCRVRPRRNAEAVIRVLNMQTNPASIVVSVDLLEMIKCQYCTLKYEQGTLQ
jgi:hypothetical protein